MFRPPQPLSAGLLACTMLGSAHAGPREAAIMAAMHLSDQTNYSWVATVTDDARTYDIAGRTRNDGYTRVKMPVVNSVRRRLDRGVTDPEVELIFRGTVACVIETETGWKTPDELPISASRSTSSISGSRSIRRGPRSGSILPGGPVTGGDRRDAARNYSNLQLGLSLPHEELGVIVSSHDELAVADNVVTGTLTDLGAQLLLVRDGQKGIAPIRAMGTFKLWLRNGIVWKYQVKLEGALVVESASGRRTIVVQQTTNTLIKDVGTTTFEIPEQARRRLNG